MRIATWNVNSLAVRLPQVLDWLGAHRPDALCLQETKLTDDKFPHAALAEAGYAAQWFGQKTYNGVALLTPVGSPAAEAVVKNIPGFFDEQSRVIAATSDTKSCVVAEAGTRMTSESIPTRPAAAALLFT